MSKNDITGDRLVGKAPSDAFRDGYDRIFSKKTKGEVVGKVYNKTYGQHEEFDTEAEMVERITGTPKPPAGYTAEELERDNPYNQWLHEK